MWPFPEWSGGQIMVEHPQTGRLYRTPRLLAVLAAIEPWRKGAYQFKLLMSGRDVEAISK